MSRVSFNISASAGRDGFVRLTDGGMVLASSLLNRWTLTPAPLLWPSPPSPKTAPNFTKSPAIS
jgi:hypothetical protein